jgi:hypothetical protein
MRQPRDRVGRPAQRWRPRFPSTAGSNSRRSTVCASPGRGRASASPRWSRRSPRRDSGPQQARTGRGLAPAGASGSESRSHRISVVMGVASQRASFRCHRAPRSDVIERRVHRGITVHAVQRSWGDRIARSTSLPSENWAGVAAAGSSQRRNTDCRLEDSGAAKARPMLDRSGRVGGWLRSF